MLAENFRVNTRIIWGSKVVYGEKLPERARRALVEAIEEAEAVLYDLNRDPVVGVLRRYLGWRRCYLFFSLRFLINKKP